MTCERFVPMNNREQEAEIAHRPSRAAWRTNADQCLNRQGSVVRASSCFLADYASQISILVYGLQRKPNRSRNNLCTLPSPLPLVDFGTSLPAKLALNDVHLGFEIRSKGISGTHRDDLQGDWCLRRHGIGMYCVAVFRFKRPVSVAVIHNYLMQDLASQCKDYLIRRSLWRK